VSPYELKACPKPKRARGKGRGRHPSLKRSRPLKNRTPMKQRNAKRKGSAFPKVRDSAHCVWVVDYTDCVGAGRLFTRPVSLNDIGQYGGDCVHICWGAHDPAHVGKHRSKGAPDLGHVVNMCRALHDFYDQHRNAFAKVTGITERELELIAAGNALKYVESRGVPHLGAQP